MDTLNEKLERYITGSSKNIQQRIVDVLQRTSNPFDLDAATIAKKSGLSVDEVNRQLFSLVIDFFCFGKSAGKKTSFDSKQVSKGMKVEMEHTRNPLIANKIVQDHLTESSSWKIPYYTALDKMETESK